MDVQHDIVLEGSIFWMGVIVISFLSKIFTQEGFKRERLVTIMQVSFRKSAHLENITYQIFL